VPGTAHFADLVRHPENERVPRALVIRQEGAVLYFNADHVSDRITALVTACATPPKVVVLFMGSVPFVDLAGAELLVSLHRNFGRQGILFRLAEVHGEVRAALRRAAADEALGVAANQT